MVAPQEAQPKGDNGGGGLLLCSLLTAATFTTDTERNPLSSSGVSREACFGQPLRPADDMVECSTSPTWVLRKVLHALPYAPP